MISPETLEKVRRKLAETTKKCWLADVHARKNGKKYLIDSALSSKSFSIVKSAVAIDEPDSLILECYNPDDLKSKSVFVFQDEKKKEDDVAVGNIGLGAVEEIVAKKLEDYRKQDEIDRLKKELEETRAENDDLVDEIAELQGIVDSFDERNKRNSLLEGIGSLAKGAGLIDKFQNSPLGGLFGLSDEMPTPIETFETSGIVEDIPTEQLESPAPVIRANADRIGYIQMLVDSMSTWTTDKFLMFIEAVGKMEADQTGGLFFEFINLTKPQQNGTI